MDDILNKGQLGSELSQPEADGGVQKKDDVCYFLLAFSATCTRQGTMYHIVAKRKYITGKGWGIGSKLIPGEYETGKAG